MLQIVENLSIGFVHFLLGISTVFIALSLVVGSTWLLVHYVVPWTEQIWPEEEKSGKIKVGAVARSGNEISESVMAVITRAVIDATDGKGVPVSVKRC